VCVELEPEVADRHPQEVDVRVVAGAPDCRQHLSMGDELAGMLDEVGEQSELRRRQPELLAAEPGTVIVEVDDEVAVLDPPRPLGRRGRRSPQRGLDPGHELRQAERLRDVVVRAELQAADLVGLGAARGHHEDRDPAELADPLDHLPAVEAGQGHVEDDEVRVPLIELAQRLVAARREDRLVARRGHPQLQQRGELGLVFDDEDPLSHGRPRSVAGRPARGPGRAAQ
jgi:hypothetical protein